MFISSNKYKTSRKFLGASLLIIGVSALLAVATSLAPLPEFVDNYAIPPSVESKGEEANALLKDYNDCIDRLDTKYPVEEELLPEDEDAYLQDYDACETIRIKQNAAADEYNNSLEQL